MERPNKNSGKHPSSGERLPAAEEFHRQLFLMGESYFEIDLSGKLTLFNDYICQFHGRSAEELRQLDYRAFMNPQEARRVYEVFNEVYRTGNPSEVFEYDIIRKNGSLATAESVVSLLRGPTGQPQGFCGITRDVTRRKEAEKALRQSEKKHRGIIENMAEGYYETDVAGRFIYVNAAVCRNLGYSLEELMGLSYREYMSPATADKTFQVFNEVFSTGVTAYIYECELIRKDGEKRIHEISVSMLRNDDGEPIGFFGIARDRTDFMRLEQTVQESEEKYRNILANMEEGYYEVDLGGTFTFVNKAMGAIHGYPADRLVGLNNRAYTLPEDLNRIYTIYNKVYTTGIPAKVLNYSIVRQDGSRGVIETSASLLRDPDGKPIGFYGVSRDVTERKRAEEELARYRDQLEEMVRERTQELEGAQHELIKRERLAVLGQLTATVSHELRNPLGVIRSSNFYLQKSLKTADPKIDKHFKRIDAQVALCDRIVGDLLEFTRGRNVSVATEDVNPWLEQLLEQQQDKEGVIIERRLASDLPPVAHDCEKMQRVVVNILDNAIQAVRSRQATITDVRESYLPEIRVSTSADDTHMCLAIEDNGIGMDQKTCQHAFDPLFTTRAQGTGIGLSIVQKIVSEHGGHIDLESTFGEGTRLTVRLPRTRSET